MKDKNIKPFIALLFVFILPLLSGCRMSITKATEEIITNTPAVETLTPTAGENAYPSTPEEVIRAFLITYPTNQIYAIQYLSPNFVQTLDEESASKLLPESGDVTGFIIESGATSAESEKSEIVANIAFQNTSSQVLFRLEIIEGRWVINEIAAQ